MHAKSAEQLWGINLADARLSEMVARRSTAENDVFQHKSRFQRQKASIREEEIRVPRLDWDPEISFKYVFGVKSGHGGVQCRHALLQYVQENAQALRGLNWPTVPDTNDPLEKLEAGVKAVYWLPAGSKNAIEENHIAWIFPLQPITSGDSVHLRGCVQNGNRKAWTAAKC